MGGLAMRAPTQRTAHTFTAALGMMMAPSHAPGALNRAGVGASTCNSAVNSADGNILANELLSVRTGNGVFDVYPRNAGIRVGRHAHNAREGGEDVNDG